MQHNYNESFKNIRIRPLEIDDIEKLRTWRNDKRNSLYLSRIPYITEKMQQEWFDNYHGFDYDEVMREMPHTGVISKFGIEYYKEHKLFYLCLLN